jgi:hypothetical protein
VWQRCIYWKIPTLPSGKREISTNVIRGKKYEKGEDYKTRKM